MNLLEKLRARLKELAGKLDAFGTKDQLTADDLAAMEALQKEIAEAEGQITALEEAEKTKARLAVPAGQAATDPARPAAEVKQKLTTKDKIGLLLSGMCAALLEEGTRGYRPVMRQLDANGYGELAREFEPHQKRTMNSSNATSGGILVPDDWSMDIIDILRPNASFLQGQPEVRPMPRGTLSQPAAASGSTAGYRGEAKPASVTQPTFKGLNMSAKLLAGIVPISNQLIRWSGPDVAGWAQSDLGISMGTVMDYNAFFGDGMTNTPLGILNVPGVYRVAATGGTAPTYTQVDADARKLLNRLENNNVPMLRVAWRMAPRVFNYLADMRDGNGNAIYPSLQGDNPRFKGYPVVKTTQFPINLGGTTDESYVALIAFGHVFFGDCMSTQFAISDVATVKNGNDQINAFQDGVTFIRAESEHDFDIRYVESIALLTEVRWGALS